jgi:hypothetical protein
MKLEPQPPVDGPATMRELDAVVRHILNVPRDEILRREVEYKKKAALNPIKRGPKSKRTA